jgi:hypothetical protein
MPVPALHVAGKGGLIVRPQPKSLKHKARPCTFCKHLYLNPCDGKVATCPNLLFLKSIKPKEKRK